MAAALRMAGHRPMVLAAQQVAPPPPVAVAARPTFDIRPSQLREDLHRAAWLRADAYYEVGVQHVQWGTGSRDGRA